MNLKFRIPAFFFVAALVLFVSCKKEEIAQQYLRGANAIALAADGNIIVAGYNSSTGKGYEAMLTLASSSNGDTLWSRKFGGSYSDAFFSVKRSNTGGFIAAGFSNKASSSSPLMLVTITDANGSLVKSATFGSTTSSNAQGFCVLPHANPDSGYIVAGYIQKSGRTDRDIFLVRINNAGTELWEKSIGARSKDPYDTVYDAAYNIIAAPDSGYYVTGSLNGYSSCCGKVFLMKISPQGDSLWTKTYATGIGYALALTSDGGIAISGTLQGSNNNDIFLIKTDTAGNMLWSKTYGGTGYEYGAAMIETSDGGFAISGITNSEGAGYDDAYVIRTNSTGTIIWAKTYGGTDNDQGFGILQYGNGEFSIGGLSNTGGSYIFLNRISEDGTQLWYKNLQ